jgi:hypothetical protein
MADDEARPGRPPAAGVIFAASVASIQTRSDGGQDDGQQRDRDRDAHERDEHPGDADAAQERHRQQDQQRAAAGDERLEGHAGAAILAAISGGRAQSIESGHVDRRAGDGDPVERGLGLAGLGLAGIDPTLGREVHEREGRPAVLGDERPVMRGGVRGDPGIRKRSLDLPQCPSLERGSDSTARG